jgi:hypothetical protein
MKLEARHVRFLNVLPWFTRRRVQFVGRANTLQLLETALVVEGYRQRLFLPVVDFLFRQALSEWTTVTVPYSRIVRHRYNRKILMRLLVLAILWGPLLLVTAAFTAAMVEKGPGPDSWDVGYFLCMFSLLSLVLSLYLCLRVLAPRNHLWFRQADGSRALLVFRIPARQRQAAFVAQLKQYRDTAAQRDARRPG